MATKYWNQTAPEGDFSDPRNWTSVRPRRYSWWKRKVWYRIVGFPKLPRCEPPITGDDVVFVGDGHVTCKPGAMPPLGCVYIDPDFTGTIGTTNDKA